MEITDRVENAEQRANRAQLGGKWLDVYDASINMIAIPNDTFSSDLALLIDIDEMLMRMPMPVIWRSPYFTPSCVWRGC